MDPKTRKEHCGHLNKLDKGMIALLEGCSDELMKALSSPPDEIVRTAFVEEFVSVAARVEETAPPDGSAIVREMTAHAAATQAFIDAELRGDSGNTTQPIEDFLKELGVR